MYDKMREAKEEVKKQNSREGFDKNVHACSVEGVSGI